MARVSKTSPFGPRAQPESRANTEGEKKEDESSSSSSTTSSSNSESKTQDKKQEEAKGKSPMLYEMLSGPKRSKETVTKRGRGKSMAYTARLWSKHNPRIDVYVSSDDEPNDADTKAKGTQDEKKEKTKGKRPMQARNRDHKTIVAKGSVTKRGRGKSAAHTLRLWSKHNPRSPPKGPKTPDPKVKEANVFQGLETDSAEVCKQIKIESLDNDDDDADNDGRGGGTQRNLTSLNIEVVGK